MLRRPIAIRAAILACDGGRGSLGCRRHGKWSGDMGDRRRHDPDRYFQAGWDEADGTIDGPGGEAMQIQDGKVDGDKIVFTVAFNDMKIVHEGTIKGDTISLQIKMDGGGGVTEKAPVR